MKYTTSFVNAHYVTADIPQSTSHFGDKDNVINAATTTAASDKAATSSAQPSQSNLPPLLAHQQHRPVGYASEDGKRQKADVYLKCTNWPQQLVLPDNTNATYDANEPLAGLFGSLNEHEFSSNIWFLNPRLKHAVRLEDGKNAIQHIIRHYYEDTYTIFYDTQKMSTRYFDNCSEFTTKLIVRVDCDTGDDVTAANNVSASVKLRVCRSKYNWSNKTTLVLSRAIELPMRGWNVSQIRPPTDSAVPLIKATKSRRLVFWGVTLTHCGKSYLFRIAFRHDLDAHNHVECNIECEDPINGDLFGLMFYALYMYYLYQYETQERSIDPVIGNHKLFQKSYFYTAELTEEQRRIIDTLRLVAWPTVDTEADTANVNPSVAEFVTYLGVCTYVYFSDSNEAETTGIEYDKQFRHIKINESKDNNHNDNNTVLWTPSDEVFFE